MARSQRKYDHEYKVQAVKLAREIANTRSRMLISSDRWTGLLVKFSIRKGLLIPVLAMQSCSISTHQSLLRRYIPKGVSIDLYSADQILHFADEMNTLPPKTVRIQDT